MIKVTPLSIGGNSGSAAYIRVDGAGKLTHMQKREIEFRVNNHDRLTEEKTKLLEALSSVIESIKNSDDSIIANIDFLPFIKADLLLNQLKGQDNDK